MRSFSRAAAASRRSRYWSC